MSAAEAEKFFFLPISYFFPHHAIPSAAPINFEARALWWEVMRGIDPTLPSSVYLSLAFTPRASGKMESSPTVKQISMQFIPRNMHFCCKHERPPKAEGRCASYCSLKKVTVLLIKKKDKTVALLEAPVSFYQDKNSSDNVWREVATHPSILDVKWKHPSTPFSANHEKPIRKGVCKQRPKSLRRYCGLKTGDRKVMHTCFHCVYFSQNMWENHTPPSNIYCEGLASLARVP